jgi:hypothetical protein
MEQRHSGWMVDALFAGRIIPESDVGGGWKPRPFRA